MKKLLTSKKGFNDITIISSILILLFFTAAILPFLNDSLGSSYSEFDTSQTAQNAREGSENVGQFNAFTVLLNVLKLSLWDVGDTLGLPWFLDVFFTIIAIVLILVIGRNIWIGGGA